MLTETPEDFLTRNGLPFTRKGQEAIMTCPLCGKPGHLSVNLMTFKWRCLRCDEHGAEFTLKRAFGLLPALTTASGTDVEDAQAQQLARDIKAVTEATDVERWTLALANAPEAERARRYLTEERKIPLMTAIRYRLGWSAYADGKGQAPAQNGARSRRVLPGRETAQANSSAGWLVMPAFTKWGLDGRPDPTSAAVVKLRSVPPAKKEFRRLLGGESVLFQPVQMKPAETVLVVGGEMDALSVVAAGWLNVVSPTTGEASATWAERLSDCQDIVVIFDNDDAGRKGAAKAAEALGTHRTRIGQWPAGCKDANEALCKLGSGFDVAACVAASKSAVGDAVVKLGALREKYISNLRGSNPTGITTGWPDLDALIGGVREGELTLITGETSSGKSTFCSHWALNMATQNVKTLICPFEMGADRQLDKWVRQWSQTAPKSLTESALGLTLDALETLPVWMLRHYGSIKIESMRNVLRYAIKRLGVTFVLVDHLHFMVDSGPNERPELAQMMKMLAHTAHEMRIHIAVVAHPRQNSASEEKHRDNRIVQMSDVKGASDLKQDADNILSVWRPRKVDRTGVASDGYGSAVVYSLKARSDYSMEGSVAFKFAVESARYEAADLTLAESMQAAMTTTTTTTTTTAQPVHHRRRVIPQPARPAEPAPKERNWMDVDDD